MSMMKNGLFLILLLSVVTLSTLYGAVQSKRIMVGIYTTQSALSQARKELYDYPAFMKVKRDYGFTMVDREKGNKQALYLETFGNTKELLASFIVISRRFSKAFIEDYEDNSIIDGGLIETNTNILENKPENVQKDDIDSVRESEPNADVSTESSSELVWPGDEKTAEQNNKSGMYPCDHFSLPDFFS